MLVYTQKEMEMHTDKAYKAFTGSEAMQGFQNPPWSILKLPWLWKHSACILPRIHSVRVYTVYCNTLPMLICDLVLLMIALKVFQEGAPSTLSYFPFPFRNITKTDLT